MNVYGPWWKNLTDEEKGAVRQHLQQFGVNPDVTWQVEIQGDSLRVWEYHTGKLGKAHLSGSCVDPPSGEFPNNIPKDPEAICYLMRML